MKRLSLLIALLLSPTTLPAATASVKVAPLDNAV
mgnify:CR=1 FL=1